MQIDAVEKDAARYRWLKEVTNEQFDYLSRNWCGLDSEIDDAIQAESRGEYWIPPVKKQVPA